MGAVDQNQRAHDLWNVLVNLTKPITYGEAAKRISIHHRPLRYPLGLVQDYCIENDLPVLTGLVVSRSTGRPSSGFLGTDEIDFLLEFNWDQVPNPFVGLPRNEIEKLATEVLSEPRAYKDVYAKVRVRGDQQRVFRCALLEAYEYRCAVCDLSFVEVLQAAHIVPWVASDLAMRVSPRNGILMCSNHHRLFDEGWFSIDRDYRVVFADPTLERSTYTAADAELVTGMDGKIIRLPSEPWQRPDPELLSRKNEGLE